MWQVQPEFQPQKNRPAVLKSSLYPPVMNKKADITSRKELRERFRQFFENRYRLEPELPKTMKNAGHGAKSNAAILFAEAIEFNGLNSINIIRDTNDKNPEQLKGLLTIFEIFFEEYDNALQLNCRKVRSYFEFLDHAKSLASEYADEQIEVKQDSTYMAAFAEGLSKKARLIQSTLGYLTGERSLALAVERFDENRLQQLAEKAEQMTLFEIMAQKGSLKR